MSAERSFDEAAPVLHEPAPDHRGECLAQGESREGFFFVFETWHKGSGKEENIYLRKGPHGRPVLFAHAAGICEGQTWNWSFVFYETESPLSELGETLFELQRALSRIYGIEKEDPLPGL